MPKAPATPPPVASQSNPERLAADLAILEALDLAGLRREWRRRLGAPPPPIRATDLLLRMLAWHLQAAVFGDLEAEDRRRLKQLAKTREPNGEPRISAAAGIWPGTVLLREWQGVRHRVEVTRDGFLHAGRRYRSLSQVARAIAGTRWSGPRFFGLLARAEPPKP